MSKPISLDLRQIKASVSNEDDDFEIQVSNNEVGRLIPPTKSSAENSSEDEKDDEEIVEISMESIFKMIQRQANVQKTIIDKLDSINEKIDHLNWEMNEITDRINNMDIKIINSSKNRVGIIAKDINVEPEIAKKYISSNFLKSDVKLIKHIYLQKGRESIRQLKGRIYEYWDGSDWVIDNKRGFNMAKILIQNCNKVWSVLQPEKDLESELFMKMIEHGQECRKDKYILKFLSELNEFIPTIVEN